MGASQEVDDALGTLRNATLNLRDAAQLKANPLVLGAEIFTDDGPITKAVSIVVSGAGDTSLTLPDLAAVTPGSLWIVKTSAHVTTLLPFTDDDGMQRIDGTPYAAVLTSPYSCVGLLALTPEIGAPFSSWLLVFEYGGALPRPPHLAISLPADNTTVVTEGDTVSFAAMAAEADGTDRTASIAWTSDLDGALHTGSPFSTDTLSVGTHTITATYTNGDSLSASDTVTVTVNAAP